MTALLPTFTERWFIVAKKSTSTKRQMRETGPEALGDAQAKEAGANFEWHFGRITRMGYFEIACGRSVSILWEEGGATSQQGEIGDEQWEIFKLAFESTGRIVVLSDAPEEKWMYDYRFLEAVR